LDTSGKKIKTHLDWWKKGADKYKAVWIKKNTHNILLHFYCNPFAEGCLDLA